MKTRIWILELVRDRTLCVGRIAVGLDVTQGAVSQHLRILRDVDLGVAEKRGHFVHYRLNEKTLSKWKGMIDKLLTTNKDYFRPHIKP